MKIKSTLSRVVAQQMGTIQGKLAAYGVGKLRTIIAELNTRCPSDAELRVILRTIVNIQNILNKYKRQVLKYNSLITKLDTVISSVDVTVKVLRVLPIPTAVAGVGVPIGLTNRYSESLINLSEYLDNLKNDKESIKSILSNSTLDTNQVEALMTTINSKLIQCVEADGGTNYLTTVSELLRGNTESNDRIEGPVPYVLDNGAQYFIEVIPVEEGTGVPRRRAQAKNLEGVVVMKGDPSYSSDENILIEELIFRLENQLS
jgi:hypothetical protein